MTGNYQLVVVSYRSSSHQQTGTHAETLRACYYQKSLMSLLFVISLIDWFILLMSFLVRHDWYGSLIRILFVINIRLIDWYGLCRAYWALYTGYTGEGTRKAFPTTVIISWLTPLSAQTTHPSVFLQAYILSKLF